MLPLSKLLRSVSLRVLILFGFTLAILPLVATLVSAVRSVEELAAASMDMALHLARMSQKSEMLRDRLVDFERKAKRNLVLDDADSRSALDDAYRNFTGILGDLSAISGNPALISRLAELGKDGEAIYRLSSGPPTAKPAKPGRSDTLRRGKAAGGGKPSLERADGLFADLGGKAGAFARAAAGAAEQEVKAFDGRSERVRQRMVVESSILLPISVALISLLTFLIVRSVRQMDLAIRKLGAGDFSRRIKVTGPKDLEYLGERLDWLRNRLRALEQAKQQFMRHVSHELKTPLATIHEGTGLLADEVVGELNTEQRDIANILLNNTQRLDALIAELIHYSQVNDRPSAARREIVDVGQLLKSVIEDNQIRLRAKSLTVQENARSARISGNPEQLRTVIDNLLSNAIKYSPNGGEIRVGLRSEGGHMELEVEDDGPGIPLEERKQVFEPFFQGKFAKEGGVGGTGLGLAIMSECVAAHHGKAEALEPNPDKRGARVRVRIPSRQED